MDIKTMKISEARQINKSRELSVLLDCTLMQRRILYSCMAIMNPIVPQFLGMTLKEITDHLRTQNAEDMSSLRDFHIDLYDFGKTWKIGGNSIVEKINLAIGYKENAVPQIMGMGFKHIGESGDLTFINVISECSIKKDYSAIHIRLTDSIVPHLINLTSYTQLPFQHIIGFKCNYSFTMLEHLLKRYVKETQYPNTTLKLDALHRILATSHIKSYMRWTEFKNSVLDKINKDFSEIKGGGYNISFEPIFGSRRGRGRPSVEAVTIRFDDTGVRRFRSKMKARSDGVDYLESIGEHVGKPRLPKLKKEKNVGKDPTLCKQQQLQQLQLMLSNMSMEDDDLMF